MLPKPVPLTVNVGVVLAGALCGERLILAWMLNGAVRFELPAPATVTVPMPPVPLAGKFTLPVKPPPTRGEFALVAVPLPSV